MLRERMNGTPKKRNGSRFKENPGNFKEPLRKKKPPEKEGKMETQRVPNGWKIGKEKVNNTNFLFGPKEVGPLKKG